MLRKSSWPLAVPGLLCHLLDALYGEETVGASKCFITVDGCTGLSGNGVWPGPVTLLEPHAGRLAAPIEHVRHPYGTAMEHDVTTTPQQLPRSRRVRARPLTTLLHPSARRQEAGQTRCEWTGGHIDLMLGMFASII